MAMNMHTMYIFAYTGYHFGEMKTMLEFKWEQKAHTHTHTYQQLNEKIYLIFVNRNGVAIESVGFMVKHFHYINI